MSQKGFTTVYIKDLGTHCVRDRQSFLQPSAQQNTGKWDGSKQSQEKKKTTKLKGWGPGPEGTVQMVQLTMGVGWGRMETSLGKG